MQNQNKKFITVKKTKPTVTVAIRQQSLEEEREFNAAFELLLAEMVRQHLGCEEKRK